MASAPENSLETLRKAIAGLERSGAARGARPFGLGSRDLDASLVGGLAAGALHEVYARGPGDAAAAAGFGLGLGLRAAGERALVWVRQAVADVEAGGPYGDGLEAFGVDPARLIVVRTVNSTETLRAAAEALGCAALGAALVEFWGEPGALDLRASRRLSLAAEASGVTLVMIRLGARPAPSVATSRWSVAAAASAPLEANAPGRPAFEAALLRHRGGIAPRTWRLEWDHDQSSFGAPPLPRFVVPVPADRPARQAGEPLWRRAG